MALFFPSRFRVTYAIFLCYITCVGDLESSDIYRCWWKQAPGLTIENVALTVDDDGDHDDENMNANTNTMMTNMIHPRDWVTLRCRIVRQHWKKGVEKHKDEATIAGTTTNATAVPRAGTLYDRKKKDFVYGLDHIWILLTMSTTMTATKQENPQDHVLLGAWKITDVSAAEVDDALGFWAPSTTGPIELHLRALSTVYLDAESDQTLSMEVS